MIEHPRIKRAMAAGIGAIAIQKLARQCEGWKLGISVVEPAEPN